MKPVEIKGIIPPVITPMDPRDESVNIPALRDQIERQIAAGVHGIFPLGTNGEAYILDLREKEEVQEAETDELINKIYDGSADKLFAALLGRKKLSAEQIDRLRQIVETMK